jgi:hypothetical protein
MEASRGDKTLCMPFESAKHYNACMRDATRFRQTLTALSNRHPARFPARFGEGFSIDDKRVSTRQQLAIRRIALHATKEKFSVRPSCVLPYRTATTEEVEKGLFLRHWGVPYDALAYVFGRPASCWSRAKMSLGRPSLVGTTVKTPEDLPAHITADAKHTELRGHKVFVPTVVAAGGILGATVTAAADAVAREAAYGEFAREARELAPSYSPQSVCTDGWEATQKACKTLFDGLCVMLGFLHSILKISERCASNTAVRFEVLDKAWAVYKAETRITFAQRVRRLREGAEATLPDGGLKHAVLKRCSKKAQFLKAYDHPRAHRPSNAVERLINHLDRRLFAMRKFHGTLQSGRLAVRALALQWNCHPDGPRLRAVDAQRRSPFHDLNGFEYHQNWLHNLLIAASRGGRRL